MPPRLLHIVGGRDPAVVEVVVNEYKKKQKQWEELRDFLASWWYNIDFQGLLVILSTYVSHFYLKESPVWLLVLGASGTGKSAIALKSVEVLDNVRSIVDITPNTFLSGFEAGGGGLLQVLNRKQDGNGIFTVSDLSVMTSKRPEVVGEILGQLRKIADGYHSKDVGNKEDALVWRGKVTMIAAGTEAVEKHWAVYRSLGERFMNLTWKQDSTREANKRMNAYSAKHVGNEEHVKAKFQQLVRQFVDSDNLTPVGVDTLRRTILKLEPLTRLIALLRITVKREALGSRRNVVEIGKPEGVGRMTKVLANIARGSATLFRRKDVCSEDLKLACRVGIDSVPKDRLKPLLMLDRIERQSDQDIGVRKLSRVTGIARTTLYRVLEDLEYIGMVKPWINDEAIDNKFCPKLTESTKSLLSEVRACLK